MLILILMPMLILMPTPMPILRVAPGRCRPGAPADPDVRISRIRFLGSWIRYVLT